MDNDVNEALADVLEAFPRMSGSRWGVVDSRGQEAWGQLEFYPPRELYNPRPGYPTIEVFNPDLKGAELRTALLGEMLHYFPSVNSRFAALRRAYENSLTPDQQFMDKRAYARYADGGGEMSPGKWFEMSRLDAHIRGRLAPDAKDDWAGIYTPFQERLLHQMWQEVTGDYNSLVIKPPFEGDKAMERVAPEAGSSTILHDPNAAP